MTSAAVIIGCWQEHQQPVHQEVISNIISFINNNKFSAILVSAAHNKLIKDNQGINNWIDSEERIFHSEQGVDWIRQQYQSAVKDRTHRAFATPNRLILDHNWQDKECISISEQWQLEYLLNHDLSYIDSVWYFGIGWNLGVKQDKIGWGQLCDLIRYKHVARPINVLTNKTCVVENLEPYAGKHFTQCEFSHPNFIKTDWKETELNIYTKTNWDWSPG